MSARDPWEGPRPVRRRAAIAIAAAAVVAGGALLFAAVSGQEAYEPPEGLRSAAAVQGIGGGEELETDAPDSGGGADAPPGAEEECIHEWETDFVSAEPVEHEAVTEAVLVDHTVCNACGEVVDGRAAQHTAETGHKGSTPNVPVLEEVVVEEAWTEEPAPGELVPAGTETCRLCGETREVES